MLLPPQLQNVTASLEFLKGKFEILLSDIQRPFLLLLLMFIIETERTEHE